MKLLWLIIPVAALENPKLCKNCKHFIKNDWNDYYSKCAVFPRIETSNLFLINGKHEEDFIDYLYCSTVREFDTMCGKEGKLYKTHKN